MCVCMCCMQLVLCRVLYMPTSVCIGMCQWRSEGGQGGPWPPGASLGGGAGPACRGEF